MDDLKMIHVQIADHVACIAARIARNSVEEVAMRNSYGFERGMAAGQQRTADPEESQHTPIENPDPVVKRR